MLCVGCKGGCKGLCNGVTDVFLEELMGAREKSGREGAEDQWQGLS